MGAEVLQKNMDWRPASTQNVRVATIAFQLYMNIMLTLVFGDVELAFIIYFIPKQSLPNIEGHKVLLHIRVGVFTSAQKCDNGEK